MTRMRFEGRQTWDPLAKTFATNGTVQLFAMTDSGYTSPLVIYDTSGAALSQNRLDVAQIGQVADFDVDDQVQVRWKSGNYAGIWTSYTAVYQKVDAAVASAAASASSAAQAASSAAASASQVAAYIAGQSTTPGGGSGGLDQQALAAALLNYPQMWYQSSTGTWPSRPIDSGTVLAIMKPGTSFPPDPSTGQTNVVIVQQASS